MLFYGKSVYVCLCVNWDMIDTALYNIYTCIYIYIYIYICRQEPVAIV